jgi:sialate O-acetylesterase
MDLCDGFVPRIIRLEGGMKIAVMVWMAMVGMQARAEVRLPAIFSDHAVLQRERPIHVWGWATPGAHVQASFHLQSVSADADARGKWSLWLAPERAGGPYTLAIVGDGGRREFTDVLVGDVWFASGQSNMELPLKGFVGSAEVKDGAKEIAAATNPRLRLLLARHQVSEFPLNDNAASWQLCTPVSAAEFSAVAYFFGREIAAKEDVPVGLIDSTWGGTPAATPARSPAHRARSTSPPAFAARAAFADQQGDLAATIAAEKAEDAAARAAGRPMPQHSWHPGEASWLPAGIYNGMVAPFAPYSVKGFLWYQGETNSGPGRAPYYRTLFPALIADWRAQFAQGELPFLFVQISSFNSPPENWGMVRDAQRRTLAVAGTAMAVSLDVGLRDNVHPPDKQTVATRLELGARALVYGERVQYAGPLFRQATNEAAQDGGYAMRVWFDHAAGLRASAKSVGDFEIAGADRRFVAAEARVEGETILVWSRAVQQPRYVRYGWTNFVGGYLYNGAGLPASTFTSEEHPELP